MEGYYIVYRKPNCRLDLSFFGRPIASRELSPDDEIDAVRNIFEIANPSCEVVAIIADDY